jgi:hypothetical protein
VGSLLAAVALAGCGAPAVHPRAQPPPPVARAQATHEYPSPAPGRQAVLGGSVSAVSAIAGFAGAYINWDAQTVSGDMRALAEHSIGEARSAMQLAAAQTASDYELQRGGIANHGVVEAIAPLGGRPNQYVVVTRELTTATATTAYQGLQPAWHVTVTTVAELGPDQWVVSGWQPES